MKTLFLSLIIISMPCFANDSSILTDEIIVYGGIFFYYFTYVGFMVTLDLNWYKAPLKTTIKNIIIGIILGLLVIYVPFLDSFEAIVISAIVVMKFYYNFFKSIPFLTNAFVIIGLLAGFLCALTVFFAMYALSLEDKLIISSGVFVISSLILIISKGKFSTGSSSSSGTDSNTSSGSSIASYSISSTRESANGGRSGGGGASGKW